MAGGGTSSASPSAKGSPGGSQGDGQAPSPPTQDGKSASTPTQDCPLQVLKPCDVDKLELAVKGVDADKAAVKTLPTLTATKVVRGDPVSDVEDIWTLRDLQQYDLVIDVLANTKASKAPNNKPAEVKVVAEYHGQKCGEQHHARLTVADLYGHQVKAFTAVGEASITVPSAKAFAPPSWLEQRGDLGKAMDSVTTPFGLVKALWDCTTPRGISIAAAGCGIRAPGDDGPRNRTLLGLVRIFPKSTWAIGVSIPAFGTFSDKREASLDGTGKRSGSHKRSAKVVGNRFQSETSSKWVQDGADGSVIETVKRKYSDADGYEIVRGDDTFTAQQLKDRLSVSSGFDIIVSYNDTEIELGEVVGKIRKQIEKIIGVIAGIGKLFDAMPAVGWKFSFDVSVLAGEIMLEWSTQYGEGSALANGRYLPVEWELQGRIDLQIIKLTLKLGFGVDLRVFKTGMVAMIEGSITLEAAVGVDVYLGPREPTKTFDVKTSAKAKLACVAKATIFGFTLVEAELSVEGGIELKKGKVILTWEGRKLDLQGELVSKKIVLKGHIKRKCLWDKKIDPPKVLLPERSLHHFS